MRNVTSHIRARDRSEKQETVSKGPATDGVPEHFRTGWAEPHRDPSPFPLLDPPNSLPIWKGKRSTTHNALCRVLLNSTPPHLAPCAVQLLQEQISYQLGSAGGDLV